MENKVKELEILLIAKSTNGKNKEAIYVLKDIADEEITLKCFEEGNVTQNEFGQKENVEKMETFVQ